MSRTVWQLTPLLASLLIFGCNQSPNVDASRELTKVDVSGPVSAPIEKFEVFTGRTQAKKYADIRARVTGYLKEADFKEGEDVPKDKVLFVIDPAPYRVCASRK